MGLGIEGGDNDNIIEIKIITFTVVKTIGRFFTVSNYLDVYKEHAEIKYI